jgi:hypothetical protein
VSSDSDLAEDFRALREHGKKKREGNAESSVAILKGRGIEFQVLNEVNHHLLVAGRFDFWPSTGKWRIRQTGRFGRGVFRLLKVIELGKSGDQRKNTSS